MRLILFCIIYLSFINIIAEDKENFFIKKLEEAAKLEYRMVADESTHEVKSKSKLEAEVIYLDLLKLAKTGKN